MSKAYSLDLRQRVIEHVEEKQDKNNVSNLFKVGIATIYRWLALKRKTGSIMPSKRKAYKKKIDDKKLSQYVEEHLDSFLSEIAKEFGVTAHGVFYALKRLKITRKKRQLYIKKEVRK